MAEISSLNDFYDSLQSLPRLISDLALSIAEAQRRVDESYVKSLNDLSTIIASQGLTPDGLPAVRDFLQTLFPARYQIAQTEVEVHADLRMASETEMGVTGNVGIKTGILAAAIGAAYARRYGYDYQAAARIRTVFETHPADSQITSALLDRLAKAPTAEVSSENRYQAFGTLLSTILPSTQASTTETSS